MIRVNITLNQNIVESLEVSGHANYSVAGSDIVCAAVSSLVLSNLLYAQENGIGQFESSQDDGYISVTVTKSTELLNHLLLAILYGLQAIEMEYKKYIKINLMEV